MTQPIILLLILMTAIGCGMVAGIFFALPCFVMAALDGFPPITALAPCSPSTSL